MATAGRNPLADAFMTSSPGDAAERAMANAIFRYFI